MMQQEHGKHNGIWHFTAKYVHSHLRGLVTVLLCMLLTGAVLILYGVPGEALRYPGLLCAVLLTAGAGSGWFHEWKKHCCLSELAGRDCQLTEDLPGAETAAEEDYEEISDGG